MCSSDLADFDPNGKSEGEVIRFCQALADQEHAEIAARRDGPAAGFFGVEGRTELFEKGVKCFLVQELLQPLVKDMPLTLGQLIIRKPHA